MKHIYLTRGFSDQLERQIDKTPPGCMAFWAGTGPAGATCGDCCHLGYWKQVRNASGDIVRTTRQSGCAEFFRISKRHGPSPGKQAEACKYFKAK